MRVLWSFFGSLLLVWLFKSSNFIYIFRQSAIFFFHFISFRFSFFRVLLLLLLLFLLHIVQSIGYIFTHISNIHTCTQRHTHTHTWRAQNTAEDESNNNKIEKKTLLFLLFFSLSLFCCCCCRCFWWWWFVLYIEWMCVSELLHDGFIMDFV